MAPAPAALPLAFPPTTAAGTLAELDLKLYDLLSSANTQWQRSAELGELLLSPGEQDDAFFVLERGEVEVSREVFPGERPIVRRIKAPGYFGEGCALGLCRTQAAKVRALTACSLRVMAGQTLRGLLRSFPREEQLLLQEARLRLNSFVAWDGTCGWKSPDAGQRKQYADAAVPRENVNLDNGSEAGGSMPCAPRPSSKDKDRPCAGAGPRLHPLRQLRGRSSSCHTSRPLKQLPFTRFPPSSDSCHQQTNGGPSSPRKQDTSAGAGDHSLRQPHPPRERPRREPPQGEEQSRKEAGCFDRDVDPDRASQESLRSTTACSWSVGHFGSPASSPCQDISDECSSGSGPSDVQPTDSVSDSPHRASTAPIEVPSSTAGTPSAHVDSMWPHPPGIEPPSAPRGRSSTPGRRIRRMVPQGQPIEASGPELAQSQPPPSLDEVVGCPPPGVASAARADARGEQVAPMPPEAPSTLLSRPSSARCWRRRSDLPTHCLGEPGESEASSSMSSTGQFCRARRSALHSLQERSIASTEEVSGDQLGQESGLEAMQQLESTTESHFLRDAASADNLTHDTAELAMSPTVVEDRWADRSALTPLRLQEGWQVSLCATAIICYQSGLPPRCAFASRKNPRPVSPEVCHSVGSSRGTSVTSSCSRRTSCSQERDLPTQDPRARFGELLQALRSKIGTSAATQWGRGESRRRSVSPPPPWLPWGNDECPRRRSVGSEADAPASPRTSETSSVLAAASGNLAASFADAVARRASHELGLEALLLPTFVNPGRPPDADHRYNSHLNASMC